ncbi:endochitinase [Colletotrichum truncatum]|uniref:Endochitinase n=1 Tax=Colletotrichum truncatum TaxID=5467 RepID=A0ACC3YCJ3_COLTU|nr:endochitinase [Colletotrichum truncatum]KAF6794029.1 endochitinase [Colletotrichum truncatum]
MFQIGWVILAFIYAQAVGICASANCLSGYRNAVYFTNWSIYARGYHPHDLPAEQISVLLYAFANVQSDGLVVSSDSFADLEKPYDGDSRKKCENDVCGCVKQLYLLKKTYRKLKVLLSIGGATYSSNIAAAAATEAKRALFSRSAIALMKDWGFDGLDIDWEYPVNEKEAQDFVLLLGKLRSEMDSYASQYAPGYHFLLTISSPAGPSNYDILPLSKISDIIDNFNLMSYDYSGPWSSMTGHQANLHSSPIKPNSTPFSTDAVVEDYISKGVLPTKILLGMPVYGRAFQQTGGLGQAYYGAGNGSWEQGVWDAKALPRPGAMEYHDTAVGASYSYDTDTQELISYDSPSVTRQKVAYIIESGLGGSMFWEASADRGDETGLIHASFNALGGAANVDCSENLLHYPNSRYATIRNG